MAGRRAVTWRRRHRPGLQPADRLVFVTSQASSALREAYLVCWVVLTPQPKAHALYADKRRLALFDDAAPPQALGVPQTTQQVLLEHVPHAEVIDPGSEQRPWSARRGLFFKPVAGFGVPRSLSARQVDQARLTRRPCGRIVAQSVVLPRRAHGW